MTIRGVVRAGAGAVALVCIAVTHLRAQTARWTLGAEPSVSFRVEPRSGGGEESRSSRQRGLPTGTSAIPRLRSE